MKILCIDFSLSQELRDTRLGEHEVLELHLPFGAVELPPLLQKHGFVPDLLIQQERLGPRLLLLGLEKLPCPKIFWSVDTQLNLHWQVHYLRLFDGLLTPHVSLFEALPKKFYIPPLLRCPFPAPNLEYKPYAERQTPISFVGRFTKHRPLRNNLAQLLRENLPCKIIEEISHQDMLALYCDSKIIPNESLALEVNARLLEGAGAGALVLSQDVGEDQNSLLVPDKEFVVWHDGVELLELLTYYLKHENEAEKIGKAAYVRVRAEHSRQSRAQAILKFASGLMAGNLKAEEARQHAWMALTQLARNQMLAQSEAELLALLPEELLTIPEVNALHLALLAESGQEEKSLEFSRSILQSRHGENSLELNSAASAAALAREDFTLALHFYQRFLRAKPSSEKLLKLNLSPKSEVELCLSWAKLFEEAEMPDWVGFRFEPLRKGQKGHLPECAMSWLFLAGAFSQDWREWMFEAERLSRKRKSAAYIHQGFLAQLSLHDQKNWRPQLEYGLSALQCCRVSEGLQEIALAQSMAHKEGRESLFLGMLTRLTSIKRARSILLHCDSMNANFIQ